MTDDTAARSPDPPKRTLFLAGPGVTPEEMVDALIEGWHPE